MSNPGKFEASGDTGEALWALSLEGLSTYDTLGSSDGFGWYGLLLDTGIDGAEYAILTEDSNGFVEYVAYETGDDALAAWDELGADYRAWGDEVEEA